MIALKWLPVLLLLGLSDTANAQQACEPAAGVQFVCGPKNAEDLVLVPGTHWIISSGMAEGSSFFLIDSRSGAWRTLPFQAKPDPAFGNCSSPPAVATFNTHGLSIRDLGRGNSRLYVVGHGARETIEVFDLAVGADGPTLSWKGCMPMPDGLAANSVAAFADGSIVATVLLMPGKSFLDAIEKRPTGAVFEWTAGSKGFVQMAGTDLPGNNGIEVAEDGSEFYVVSSGLQTVVAFSHSNPARQLRSTKPLPFTPDNVHRGPDGRLLTAGMANDVPECGGAPGPKHDLSRLATCPRGTIAVAIDARTFQHAVIVETPAVPGFSNATMVLPVGQQYWLGTFSGDRIAHGELRAR
jgi:SMP-30/Gluconolactonase/LRE-like region